MHYLCEPFRQEEEGRTLQALHERSGEGLQAESLLLPSVRQGISSCLCLLLYARHVWQLASNALCLLQPFVQARQLINSILCLLSHRCI